jgi:class 3 adenylate cyclase
MASSDLDLRLDAVRATDALPSTVIDTFRAFLLEAPEEALFRASPIRWAAQHAVPEQVAIDLFLHATHAGILEFAWGLLCPNCMAFLTTPGALRGLQRRRCNFCNIDVDGTVDDRVEVAFTVAPSTRKIRFHHPETLDLRADGLRLYFSSSLSPESAPHRNVAQRITHADRAPAGEPHVVRLTLGDECQALIAPTCHAVVYLHATAPEGSPRSANVDLFDGSAIPAKLELPPGEIELSILNRMSEPLPYFIAPIGFAGWPQPHAAGEPSVHPTLPYLTGPRLIASQTFRDLFRAASIPSEGGLELKGVTVLFTDLKGSTAIYERVGDIRAYELVRRHFAALRAVAAAEGGAIVKTIGDAVMASFADPADAMRAALRMQADVARLGEGELSLKIGLHTGPCIAVELNDRLDYFGRTVNLAARVQGLAGAGEIVCTEAVHDTRGVPETIANEGYRVSRETVPLRGIAGDVRVLRLTPSGDGPPP